MSTRTTAMRKRILTVLRTWPDTSLSTTEICNRSGYNTFEHHAYVGRQLRELARIGAITQTEATPDEAARWQLNGADQTDAAFNAVLQKDAHPMTDAESSAAQAILADVLATYMPEADAGQDGARNLQIADEAFIALAEHGYALVKLPPPLQDNEGSAHVAYAGANTVYYATPGHITSDSLQTWDHSADARDDAAALLAAADTADAMESTQ
ncbi:hypothetical protein [Mycobacteroides abscessus]|uniref:hypothetical protein n=1 Tax=Mycobacteroides abscessus TaxID=36809 RepID=UPI001F3EE32F